MFERFSPPARQVLVVAQEEARSLGHPAVGTEHVLLGLLRSEGGVAAQALASIGLVPDRVRERIVELVGQGKHSTHGQIPWNPRTRRLFDIALREAMSMGADEVGTEHVALAIASEGEGAVAQVLSVLGPGVVREAVMAAMENPPPDQVAAGPAVDVPDAVSVRLGDDVRALLRRAGGLALADDAPAVGVDHLRRALDV
jgi:ATP-dependent Clp protease ATP-binding subunit ClpC